jgi:hypothetical protein
MAPPLCLRDRVTESANVEVEMAKVSASNRARTLSKDAWESLLVDHYLRADGPFGSAPLRSLDATPVELAHSTLLEGLDPEDAKRCFLSSFRQTNVTRDVFRGAIMPKALSGTAPGYFRYLVLSTLVPALSPEDTSTKDFRERLGELLGLDGSLSDVGGLPLLWRQLSTWCERRRAKAQPYRRIELPDPGHMTLIGYSVRLAFPSWRDRDRLTHDVERIGPTNLKAPRTATAHLKHPVEFDAYSASMKDAFGDFYVRFQGGERLLSHHRFWRLLQDVCSSVEKEAKNGVSELAGRLTLLFGIDDSDLSMEFTVGVRSEPESAAHSESGPRCIEGSVPNVLQELGAAGPKLRCVPGELVQAIASGVLLFTEEHWGQWLLTKRSEIRGAKVIAIVRRNVANKCKLPTEIWHSVGGEWVFSVLGLGAVETLLLSVNQRLADGNDDLATMELIGGVRTGNVLLGRPRILPTIRATASSIISIMPVGSTRGCMTIESTGTDTWELGANSPVAGMWRVIATEPSAREVSLESEQNVKFDDRAIEHVSLADPDRDPINLEAEIEIAIRHGVALELRGSRSISASGVCDERLTDLLEAMYARGRTGWAESDLVALINHVNGVGNVPRPWDLLRVLHEAGWIQPRQLTKWRGRRWFLGGLAIIALGTGPAAISVLDGATPLVIQERFIRVAEALGGRPVGGLPIGSWSPPMLAVEGADPVELGKALGIPTRPEMMVEASPAPLSWPVEKRSVTHRELAATWSWNRGLFRIEAPQEQSPVRLERYRRARGDDRDVFLVIVAGHAPKVFTARTSAILEAYRLAERVLFTFDGTLLRRQARDGHLPEPIARMLRFNHLVNSGLLPDHEGALSFAYRVDQLHARMLSKWFGPAIGNITPQPAEGGISTIALARHRSRADRFIWQGRLIDPHSPQFPPKRIG